MLAGLAWYGVRRGQRWAWWMAPYGWLWNGINDSYVAVEVARYTGRFVPVPLLAILLGLAGLWLARDCGRREHAPPHP